MTKRPIDFANDAWSKFNSELMCVDDECLKRAFAEVWRARGEADKSVANGVGMLERLGTVDRLPFSRSEKVSG